jgi:hypothetical protein
MKWSAPTHFRVPCFWNSDDLITLYVHGDTVMHYSDMQPSPRISLLAALTYPSGWVGPDGVPYLGYSND